MDKDTLKYIVETVASMARDLAIHETRPTLEALTRQTKELSEALENARTAIADAQVMLDNGGAAMVETNELRRQLNEQVRHIEKLEGDLATTEFKRGNTQAELDAAQQCLDNTENELIQLRNAVNRAGFAIGMHESTGACMLFPIPSSKSEVRS